MSKIFLKKIGKNIQKLRLDRGYSQEKMAEKLGISRNAFGMIERGEINTSIGRINQIYKIFNIDIIKLFDNIEV
ncbi:helix-turn-helix transcriptional regulator [bacterium]|nr:helix-turn-helix transcriptional regulator [bacterium]